jgi:hypothetical protein
LIDSIFTVLRPARESYGNVTIAGDFGPCSALKAFEQGGIFIEARLLQHGVSVFPVSLKGLPHVLASYDAQGGN